MRINKFKKGDKTKLKNKKRNMFMPARRKVCRFCSDKIKTIDFKDLKVLDSFVKERGRLLSARSSGNCAKHQRQLTRAIKQARFMALVPYVRI
jgi:small subunit ribosomal protein S18